MTTPTPPPPTPTQPYKAIVSFIGTLFVSLWLQLQGRETVNSMTASEWIVTFIAAAAVAALTWGVPNPAKR